MKDQDKYQKEKVSKNLDSLRREEMNKRKEIDKNISQERISVEKTLKEKYNEILIRKEIKRLRKMDQEENYERAKKINKKLKIEKIHRYNKSLEKHKIARTIMKRESPQPHLSAFKSFNH